MSTRNDQDEPLTTGNEGTSPDPFAVQRVNQPDVPLGTPPSYATSPSGGVDGVRIKRETAVAPVGVVHRSQDFISETREEMRRVSWPSATEVKNTTIITIVAVMFFAAYLFVVDRSFTFLIEGLTNLLSRLI